MALRVYNSLTREKESFQPVHDGRVGVYVCGPTVYDDAHIGHGKTYVNFDVVVRYLRFLGYTVVHVENITDVGHILESGEDRMMKGARRVNAHPMQVAEMYTRRFYEDMDRLNVLRPDISPRATGHIPEQIELVKQLLANGHAYEVNGSVYFDVSSWPEYGKLSGRRVEELRQGVRIGANPEKRSPEDFALWKRAEPEHVMQWPSPWGMGFPGWHAECSAMATKYLGQPIDIHCGGVENKFPHHECEIAQTEAATGLPFCRYWLHNGMLMIQGEEMHKSLGNFVTLRQATDQWEPMSIRLFILQSHYRGPLDLSEEAMGAAQKGWQRLLGAVRAVRRRTADAPDGEVDLATKAMLDGLRGRFIEAMDDDFNTASALAVLFEMARETNALLAADEQLSESSLRAIDDTYQLLAGDVLGLVLDADGGTIVDLSGELVELLVKTRQELRQQKMWEAADRIREDLAQLGVVLADGPQGTTWRLN